MAYRNWADFRMTTEMKNDKARKALRQKHSVRKAQRPETVSQNAAGNLQVLPSDQELICMRNEIIRNLQNTIPMDERKGTKTCVLVSLDDLRAVRSLSPEDYMVKPQVELIVDVLMKCNTVKELMREVDYLDLSRSIFNGSRYLKLCKPVQAVLRRYVAPAHLAKEYIAVFG